MGLEKFLRLRERRFTSWRERVNREGTGTGDEGQRLPMFTRAKVDVPATSRNSRSWQGKDDWCHNNHISTTVVYRADRDCGLYLYIHIHSVDSC